MKFDPEGKKKYKKPYTGFRWRATNPSPGGYNPGYSSAFTKYRARKLYAARHKFIPCWFPKSWRRSKSWRTPEYFLRAKSGPLPYWDTESKSYKPIYTHGCVGRKSRDYKSKKYNRSQEKNKYIDDISLWES